MLTNRLELLQARINVDTIMLAWEEEQLTAKYITEEVIKERIRQSGILGMTVPSSSQLETLARSVLLSDVSGATFSDRIWANQNELRSEINKTIERALIRGENPRKSAASIKRLVRDEYVMKKRAADRIAITETARAQSIMQREAISDAGIEEYIFISEADEKTCEECAELDEQVFKVKDMNPGDNAAPIHPFCRCSTAAY